MTMNNDMPAKVVADMTLTESVRLSAMYGMLTLKADGPLPAMMPGQFAQVRIDGSKSTFLRRPISICTANAVQGVVRLLVRCAGDGTRALLETPVGATVNLMLPLGHPFTIPSACDSPLLIGGGVGVAPLLFLGQRMLEAGLTPEFLVGARSESDLLLLDELRALGQVHITTDDGSCGHRGVVTSHPRLQRPVSHIFCCGPAPMMKAVAAVANKMSASCEVSLENMMACGLGACLCCVEKTVCGNVCVCTEGPVFNINQLTWLD